MNSPEYVFVYYGRHYGRRHVVVSRDADRNTVTARHESTGDLVTAPACDCDPA